MASCQKDPLSGKCNYYLAYSNTHCNYPPNDISNTITRFGGSTGPSSRCWKNNVIRKLINKNIDSLCFESKCSYDNPQSPIATFRFKDNWYNCKKN